MWFEYALKILFILIGGKLQYCSGFCHTLTWISHECTCVPHPEPLSHLLPHPIPQGCPSAPALSALFHASNLDWWCISHMVIYMFQCYSLKSSHPCLVYAHVSFSLKQPHWYVTEIMYRKEYNSVKIFPNKFLGLGYGGLLFYRVSNALILKKFYWSIF